MCSRNHTRAGGHTLVRKRTRGAPFGMGFSLVEVMIVIVIIGLLAGAVTINVRRYMTKAKRNIAKQDIAVICEALDTYWAEKGRYPTNDEGLGVLVAPSDGGESLLAGTTDGLRDPWGRPYTYNCPASRSDGPYEVICYGADGRDGGDGADADICSDARGGGSP